MSNTRNQGRIRLRSSRGDYLINMSDSERSALAQHAKSLLTKARMIKKASLDTTDVKPVVNSLIHNGVSANALRRIVMSKIWRESKGVVNNRSKNYNVSPTIKAF